ncbi:MAG: AAA family ATPase [Cyanobacteria bacterium]|nr:AAA family ATPase [Cyanobacteriota bacterium]
MDIQFNRALNLPQNPSKSLFLWGPRQTGKSSLLKKQYLNSIYIDFLQTNTYIKYLENPHLLREELQYQLDKSLLDKSQPIILDEVQKTPVILDEIHWLIENLDLNFILCGSSARKLKRGQANLLGGRALRYELYGLCMHELKHNFDLN